MIGFRGRLKNLSTFRKALLWARPMNLSPMRQIFVESLGMIFSWDFCEVQSVLMRRATGKMPVLHQITRLRRHPVTFLALPFDVAADGVGQRNFHVTICEQIIQ